MTCRVFSLCYKAISLFFNRLFQLSLMIVVYRVTRSLKLRRKGHFVFFCWEFYVCNYCSVGLLVVRSRCDWRINAANKRPENISFFVLVSEVYLFVPVKLRLLVRSSLSQAFILSCVRCVLGKIKLVLRKNFSKFLGNLRVWHNLLGDLGLHLVVLLWWLEKSRMLLLWYRHNGCPFDYGTASQRLLFMRLLGLMYG